MSRDLEMLPTGWTLTPLNTLAAVLVSTVDKKEHDGESPVQLCNYTDVYNLNTIDGSTSFMRATASDEQIAKFSLRAGDVPITKDSESSEDIGRPSLVICDLPGVVYGYHLAIFRPSDVRNSRFLRYFFEANSTRFEMQLRTPGVTRVGLSQDILRHLRVPFPGTELAEKISDYLDNETAEIDVFIADLDELRSTLHARLISEQEALFGPAVTLGSLPQLLGKLTERDNRAGIAGGKLPLLSVSISSGVGLRSESSTRQSASEDLSRYKLVYARDIVVNRMRAFQGAIGCAPVNGIVSPDYAVFAPRNYADPAYLTELMRSPAFVSHISRRLRGIGGEDSGAVRTPRISVHDLLRIPVHLPDLEEQSSRLREWDASRKSTQELITDIDGAIALANERRAALITAAVTGQIDVTQRHRPVAEQLEADLTR